MAKSKVIIEVFITRSKKIQVEVTTFPTDGSKIIQRQLTVGSNAWNEGEFNEYKTAIFKKTRELLTTIHSECEFFLMD